MAEEQRSALTAEQLRELHAELQSELARLDKTMDSSREAAKPVALDQTSVGRVSRIDALQNQAMSMDLHARNESRRAQILDAFERMEAGTYGACARCGNAIPYGRLLVFHVRPGRPPHAGATDSTRRPRPHCPYRSCGPPSSPAASVSRVTFVPSAFIT